MQYNLVNIYLVIYITLNFNSYLEFRVVKLEGNINVNCSDRKMILKGNRFTLNI